MSAVTSIPRMTKNSLPITNERTNLALAASKQLGYNTLKKAIAAPEALMYKLREFEIFPLVTAHVKAYQASKEKQGMYSGTKEYFKVTAGALASLILSAVLIIRDTHTEHWYLVTASIIFFFVGLFLMFGSFATWRERGHGQRSISEWRSTSLPTFDRIVPEFVLLKALQIKEALPKVEFTVEYLQHTTQSKPLPDPDPFLIASLGDEKYYIEVWDEREYEKLM